MHRRRHPAPGYGLLLTLLALSGPFLVGCGASATPDEASAAEHALSPSVEAESPGAVSQARVADQDPTRPALDMNLIGYDLGSPDAPIKVIEVSDFGCGYCRVFNQETFPEIEKEFIETGIVQWKFVPFVLGMFPNGDKAGMASECAAAQGDEAFQKMRDRLFNDQTGWRDTEDPNAFFTRLAAEEGLREAEFSECIVNGERQEQLDLDVRLGLALGTRGTPAFIFQGIPVSGMIPIEGFREVVSLLLADDGEPSNEWLPVPPALGGPSLQTQVLSMGMGHGVGPVDAPIQIIEFSDFGCGYCRVFQEQTRPILDEEYVATGKVRWTYVPFVLGMFPNGDAAAVASECAAEQGDFDAMRVRLYKDQQGWKNSPNPDTYFTQLAEEEGLDATRFFQCLDEEGASTRIQQNTRLGQTAGVRGTPAFFINGFPVNGAQPLEIFRDILDVRLSAASSRN